MPTIRIDDKVWRALQQRAVPLEDTPNDVLRRVLGLEAGTTRDGETATPEKETGRELNPGSTPRQTPHEAYRLPILKAVVALGSSAAVAHVMARVGEEMKSILTPYDRQDIRSGMVRWEKAANWERFEMVREGLLKSNSPRGIWEISDKGRRYLDEHR